MFRTAKSPSVGAKALIDPHVSRVKPARNAWNNGWLTHTLTNAMHSEHWILYLVALLDQLHFVNIIPEGLKQRGMDTRARGR